MKTKKPQNSIITNYAIISTTTEKFLRLRNFAYTNKQRTKANLFFMQSQRQMMYVSMHINISVVLAVIPKLTTFDSIILELEQISTN